MIGAVLEAVGRIYPYIVVTVIPLVIYFKLTFVGAVLLKYALNGIKCDIGTLLVKPDPGIPDIVLILKPVCDGAGISGAEACSA